MDFSNAVGASIAVGVLGCRSGSQARGPLCSFLQDLLIRGPFNVNFENLVGEDAVGDRLDGRHVFALVSVSPFTASLTQVLRRSQNPRVANCKILDRA